MKTGKILCVILLCTHFQIINSQNLLNTSTWTVGSGSVSGFSQYGITSENSRVVGEDHIGNDVVLWQATPDANGTQSGGFGSSYITIDHTKDYRLSVWIKKTNSNDGSSYFKLTSYVGGAHHTLKLNGTIQEWPTFWAGDLPKLDRWYLLVGFIHKSSHSSTINEGKIYDGVTGEEVQAITDYKFKSTATKLQHRALLYGDTNTADRQFLYAPRMEIVNGNEPTINELLSLNPNSKLVFVYDNAGNQKQRFYCPDGASCSVPTPPVGRSTEKKNSITEENDIEAEEVIDIDNQLKLYPNPTKDIVNIKIQSQLLSKAESIKVYNANSSLVKILKINISNQELKVDLTNKPSGVYFLHIHMNDGSKSITKKIIKN